MLPVKPLQVSETIDYVKFVSGDINELPIRQPHGSKLLHASRLC